MASHCAIALNSLKLLQVGICYWLGRGTSSAAVSLVVLVRAGNARHSAANALRVAWHHVA